MQINHGLISVDDHVQEPPSHISNGQPRGASDGLWMGRYLWTDTPGGRAP
jgi:hypothetical protein